jgi:aminomuconate-semialdehyde/2-hydroxymuconate-6-semialdehyde dehydrogenase
MRTIPCSKIRNVPSKGGYMEQIHVAGVSVDTRHFIGGHRIPSSSTFADHSPIDGSLLGLIARGGQHEISLAVEAARAAFPPWSKTPPRERAQIMHRIADLVDARLEDLANVETMDNGALLRSNRRGVMPRVAHNFRFFADWLVNDLHHAAFETRGHTNKVSWNPAGVAALITPWNAPLMLATWKVAPALASGDTIILKPAEWSPLTASLLCDIAEEAGLPSGVLNLVQGYGEEAGAALVAHAGISRISFTGSVTTAKIVARAAAENLTPCSFELGGKSPTIIFNDADVDLAVDLAVEQYDNAGQVCLAGTRLLVEKSISPMFLKRFAERVEKIKQGDPRDTETDMGPQIHQEHFNRIEGFIYRAKSSGSEIAFGGSQNTTLGGLYFKPTLIVEPESGSEIVTDEVFGPVLTLQTFQSDAEAILMANSTEFGLAAVVVSGNRHHAEEVADQLVAGTVWINCFFVRDLQAPFGGSKKSGIGREGGTWSFDFYSDIKNTVFAPTGWKE